MPEVTLRIGEWALLAPDSIAPRVWDATAAMADRMAYWAGNNWDIRTSIMGLVMLLKNLQCQQTEKVTISRAMLDKVVRSCERQLTLINALSENHFAEERTLILHRQPLSLKKQVEIWLKDWQKDFDLYQATFTNLLPDNLPAIDADPCQLRSVFEQLLNNALKHNPSPI